MIIQIPEPTPVPTIVFSPGIILGLFVLIVIIYLVWRNSKKETYQDSEWLVDETQN